MGGVRDNMEDINRKDNLWKAIREKCLDCCDGSIKEVDKCTLKRCALYPYRYGMSEKRYLQNREKLKK